ncbi:MAG TPA: ABC transporter permease [Clostridiales bacterium]|nr:ABC transporter permease [Clostridiales bacterium]
MAMKKSRFSGETTLWALITVLVCWYLLSLTLKVAFLPSPVAVVKNIGLHFISGGMYLHLLASLGRIAVGIAFSLLLGLAVGLSMGYFPRFDRIFSPLVYLLYPIPKIALLPLVMLICGLGEGAKVTMIVLIVVFQVTVSSRDAAKAIPRETYACLNVLGASHRTMFRRIVVPATLPAIFSSLRVSMGTALSVLFFTETFGARYGMGYYIMNAWTRVNYIDMFTGIVLLGLLGYALFAFIDGLHRRCCRWQPFGEKQVGEGVSLGRLAK